MKVTIKEWNAVATWRWDMPEDDVCGICRVQFDGTCPTCKYPGDECALCMVLYYNLSISWLNGTSNWQMWPFIPYGKRLHSIEPLFILTKASIASERGLTRSLLRGYVQCVDKVSKSLRFTSTASDILQDSSRCANDRNDHDPLCRTSSSQRWPLPSIVVS